MVCRHWCETRAKMARNIGDQSQPLRGAVVIDVLGIEDSVQDSFGLYDRVSASLISSTNGIQLQLSEEKNKPPGVTVPSSELK